MAALSSKFPWRVQVIGDLLLSASLIFSTSSLLSQSVASLKYSIVEPYNRQKLSWIQIYLKLRTLGSASNASLVGAKTVKGLWPASRVVSVEKATPRAFTWSLMCSRILTKGCHCWKEERGNKMSWFARCQKSNCVRGEVAR